MTEAEQEIYDFHMVTLHWASRDDSTILFEGTKEECYIYTQAYIDALIVHTSYSYQGDGLKPLFYDKGGLLFHSPLRSLDDFSLTILHSSR